MIGENLQAWWLIGSATSVFKPQPLDAPVLESLQQKRHKKNLYGVKYDPFNFYSSVSLDYHFKVKEEYRFHAFSSSQFHRMWPTTIVIASCPHLGPASSSSTFLWYLSALFYMYPNIGIVRGLNAIFRHANVSEPISRLSPGPALFAWSCAPLCGDQRKGIQIIFGMEEGLSPGKSSTGRSFRADGPISRHKIPWHDLGDTRYQTGRGCDA